MSGLRRYAPFALLVAAQIVLVLVAPSRGATTANSQLGRQFPGNSPAAQSSPGATLPGQTGATPPGGTAPGTTSGGGTAGAGVPAAGAVAGARGVAAPATGETQATNPSAPDSSSCESGGAPGGTTASAPSSDPSPSLTSGTVHGGVGREKVARLHGVSG